MCARVTSLFKFSSERKTCLCVYLYSCLWKINFHLGIKGLAPGFDFRHTDPLLMVHITMPVFPREHHLLDYLIPSFYWKPGWEKWWARKPVCGIHGPFTPLVTEVRSPEGHVFRPPVKEYESYWIRLMHMPLTLIKGYYQLCTFKNPSESWLSKKGHWEHCLCYPFNIPDLKIWAWKNLGI